MTLAQLQIQNLRSIRSARYNFHPHLNFIVGANGSGKTSFLEAIYLLGSGRSFRTHEVSPLVSHDSEQLTVFARTCDEQSLSIQKSLTEITQVRINSSPCQTASELAHFLPCQIFYQDIFQIIDAGPSVRRSLLDWGLFHVEPSYNNLLKEYKRALKQRNALLRQKAPQRNFEPWNRILADLATALHNLRAAYFIQLQSKFKKILQQLTDIDCNLAYYKGWDRKETGKDLADILRENHEADFQRQYTYYGPQQADILIDSNHLKAKHFLSRGQQKIILIAIKFAQTLIMDKPCTFLFDDLSAELDNAHLERLFEVLFRLKGQFFITTINSHAIPQLVWQKPHQILNFNLDD